MSEQLVLASVGTAIAALVFANLLHRCKITFIPESLIAVALGCLLSIGLYKSEWGGQKDYLSKPVEYALFSLSLKLYCLPIIIFEAGWSLRQRDFFSQIGYILLLAIIGTSISVVVVAKLMLATSQYHGITDERTAYAFASLISSTDPVATLSTFGTMNVDPLLFILVFGESQINDAVAITLFEAINSGDGSTSFGQLCLHVFVLFFGSLGLGIAFAVVSIMIMRATRLGHSSADAILFLLFTPFAMYALAEQCKMSGIITVLFGSIVFGAYAPPHLTQEATTFASFLLKQAASVGDLIVFLNCGLQVVHVSERGLVMGCWVMLICLVARAAAVFPMSWICNSIKWCVSQRIETEKRHFITWKHQVMLWHSGLRGGIGLVLALELGEYVDHSNEGAKSELVDATFVMICVYLLVFGGSTGFVLQLIGLPWGTQVPEDASLYGASDQSGMFYHLGNKFRATILKPMLVGKHPHCESSLATQNVATEVIRNAVERESSTYFGDRKRSSMMRLVPSAVERFHSVSMFGSMDPAHVEEVEDAMCDSGSSSDGGAVASLRHLSELCSLGEDTEEDDSDSGERDAKA